MRESFLMCLILGKTHSVTHSLKRTTENSSRRFGKSQNNSKHNVSYSAGFIKPIIKSIATQSLNPASSKINDSPSIEFRVSINYPLKSRGFADFPIIKGVSFTHFMGEHSSSINRSLVILPQ